MSDEKKLTVMVDYSSKESNIPEYQQDFICPTCNVPSETGFGLAGGGYGIYSVCPKCCVVLTKSQIDE